MSLAHHWAPQATPFEHQENLGGPQGTPWKCYPAAVAVHHSDNKGRQKWCSFQNCGHSLSQPWKLRSSLRRMNLPFTIADLVKDSRMISTEAPREGTTPMDNLNSSRDWNFEHRIVHTDDNRVAIPLKSSRSLESLESTRRGFPRLAAIQNSDEHFMEYRRFGWLHSRVLMHRKDEIDELELALKNLDEHDERDPVRRQIFSRNDYSSTQTRPCLPLSITKQLSRYGKQSWELQGTLFWDTVLSIMIR